MTSHDSKHLACDVEGTLLSIEQELAGHCLQTDELDSIVPKSDVHPLPNESRISDYLKGSKFYNDTLRRWSLIPEDPESEECLRRPMEDVITEVLKYFDYSGTRSVFSMNQNSTDRQANDRSRNTPHIKIFPDIMVTGQSKINKEHGNNFCFREQQTKAIPKTYMDCVSCVEIRTEKKKTKNLVDNVIQTGVYARQCFVQQQNRLFFYCLLITELRVRLHMFDRSGACYSLPFDFHENAADFVRLILTVSSPDCAAVGFDTRIYWEGNSRKFRTLDAEKKSVVYTVVGSKGKGYFSRDSIRGRGTCCWRVKDDQGDEYIVKDQWASAGRHSEYELFQKIGATPGVAEMVVYETGPSVSDLRGISSHPNAYDCGHSSFRDRSLNTITFKYGGCPIDKFSTREQVLFSIRDAIQGHQELWMKGVLHRDVSTNNILITPHAHRARGLIIDLDMAIWIYRLESLAGTDFRTGTRVFQSINVLSSWNVTGPTRPRPHDHLDDLESFFYVLFWICHIYKGPGEYVTPLPPILAKWADPDPLVAISLKEGYFSFRRNLLSHRVTKFFGSAFQELIEKLYDFFKKHLNENDNFPQDKKYPFEENIAAFQEAALKDYAEVLGYFDEAIKTVKKDPGFVDPAKSSQPDFAPSNAGASDTLTRPNTRSSANTKGSNEEDVFLTSTSMPGPRTVHAPHNPSTLSASFISSESK